MELKSERIQLGKGIYLNLIKTNKFKSSLLSYYFIRPLNKEEVTKNALIPLILKRGTKTFPTSLDIEKKLEELYGTNFSTTINKRGEKQIIRFTMEWAEGKYLGNEDFKFEVEALLKEIIYNPTLEEGVFKKEYVEQEKKNLKTMIGSRINNKRSYAVERCIENMCKNEKFSIYPLGYIADLEEINESNLFLHYKELLETSPIEIFYVGNYDEVLVNHIKENRPLRDGKLIEIPEETVIKSIQNKNIVTEEFDINQGKLVLGYRAGIHYNDDLYNGLILASDILGGGTNSKLFKNVREKESLAYYIGSSIFKYKSILLIDGGIEFSSIDKTIEIIRLQINDLKEGIFSDEDIYISKKSIRTSMESIKDSIFLISEFFFSQSLSGDNRSLEKIIEDIEKTSKEEIVKAANKIVIDTIYFMKDKEINKEVK